MTTTERQLPAKLLYSRRDAAYTLSISLRALDCLVKDRQLETRKLGKKVMIPAGALSRFARADHVMLTRRTAPTA